MTKYLGGKARQGAELAQVLSTLDPYGPYKSPYWEPFVGMCGVMRHMKAPFRVGSDTHEDVILMWKAVQNGWKPPTKCTKPQYQRLQKSTQPSPERGFLGHSMAYMGIFLGPYFDRRNNSECRKAAANVNKVRPMIQNVKFFTSSYDEVNLPHSPRMLIYCDPPYVDTFPVGKGDAFNTKKFWDWVRKQSKYHTVAVTERIAPPDFMPIWKSRDPVPQYLYVLQQ
jgi:DNA adenine methylase